MIQPIYRHDDLESAVADHLRTAFTVNVSIEDAPLSEHERARIEAEIHELVTAELGRCQLERLRAVRSMSAPDAPSATSTREPADLSRERRRGPGYPLGTAAVALTGMSLPPDDAQRIEAKIQDVLISGLRRSAAEQRAKSARERDDSGEAAARLEEPTEEAATAAPGDDVGSISQELHPGGVHVCVRNAPPGARLTFPVGLMPIPEQPRPFDVAVLFPNDTDDVVRMFVFDLFDRDPNRINIGFINTTGWTKEITDWRCHGPGVRLEHVRGTDQVFMDVFRGPGGTETLVFRKPGFLGIWKDIGHFDPAFFWQVLGGHALRFEWQMG